MVAVDMDFDALATGRELGGDAPRTHASGGTRVFDGTHAVRPSFVAARAEALPFTRGIFATVLCIDLFHWARDEAAFEAMWREAWEALRPGGGFLVRTLLRDRIPVAVALANGRHRLESGAEWFLPRLADIEALLAAAGAAMPDVLPAEREGSAFILSRKPG